VFVIADKYFIKEGIELLSKGGVEPRRIFKVKDGSTGMYANCFGNNIMNSPIKPLWTHVAEATPFKNLSDLRIYTENLKIDDLYIEECIEFPVNSIGYKALIAEMEDK
jgi:hypothetical protein